MTCEIIVMNCEAVALAADSAETVFRTKVFRSAEKMFALSDNQPVGILIYDAADIDGVPWEAVIKRFRDTLGNRTYDKLEDYGSELMHFIESNEKGLIPNSAQERYMTNTIEECFSEMVDDIDERVKTHLIEKKSIDEVIIKKIIEKIVKNYGQAISSVEAYPSIPDNYAQNIQIEYHEKIREIIKQQFESRPINELIDKIEEIAIGILTHDIRKIKSSGIEYFDEYAPRHSSGIVIAGFGDAETFPSTVAYEIEGMFLNHLKYVKLEEESKKIDPEESPAEVIPLAQTDMVQQFIWGVDNQFDSYLIQESTGLFVKAFSDIINKDRKLKDEDRNRLLNKLNKKIKKLKEECWDKAFDFQYYKHRLPMKRILSILPKDELGMMAETLVNLTSFKRRVTTSTETVGGPIDVAVISRGDGFVWLKRKLYFPTDLNPKCLGK
ncbi:MAG: hypothetical protein PHU18_05590 [Dehalococcoidales bacterium]|jgi:hypothetical protein|nr:hypothetical protein [Dehalococcoidales bacterium]MDX9799605.1 hypothetical protein [Bacteroidales bacterium]